MGEINDLLRVAGGDFDLLHADTRICRSINSDLLFFPAERTVSDCFGPLPHTS